MKKNPLLISLLLIFSMTFIFTSCKKDVDPIDDDTINVSAFTCGLTDPKVPHTEKDAKGDIIARDDLTKCEVTISSIQLKNDEGSYVDVLTSPVTTDLRNFNGTVNELISLDIPVDTYTHIKVAVSGVSTTYQGNTYTASTTGSTEVTLSDVPSYTFDETHGVPNAFSSGVITFELPLAFTMTSSTDAQSVQIFFDADASTYVVSITHMTTTFNFAGIRPIPNVSVILEEGIQQIKHSPPYVINLAGTDVNYYGIHTFYDFNGVGGTIDAHTSQHVYRGEDGSLIVDAEDMITNTNPLSPNTVSATGESDIRADETFKYSEIVSYLANQGYTLEPGNTYYFSLRKTWTITTDGTTYDITRMCEPMPVYFP